MREAAARGLVALAGAALAACAATPDQVPVSAERVLIEERALEAVPLAEFASPEEVVAFARELAARERAHDAEKHLGPGLAHVSWRMPAPPWATDAKYPGIDLGATLRVVDHHLVVLTGGTLEVFALPRRARSPLRKVASERVAPQNLADSRWDYFVISGQSLIVAGLVGLSGGGHAFAFASFTLGAAGALTREGLVAIPFPPHERPYLGPPWWGVPAIRM